MSEFLISTIPRSQVYKIVTFFHPPHRKLRKPNKHTKQTKPTTWKQPPNMSVFLRWELIASLIPQTFLGWKKDGKDDVWRESLKNEEHKLISRLDCIDVRISTNHISYNIYIYLICYIVSVLCSMNRLQALVSRE